MAVKAHWLSVNTPNKDEARQLQLIGLVPSANAGKEDFGICVIWPLADDRIASARQYSSPGGGL